MRIKPAWWYDHALQDRLRNATAWFMENIDPHLTMGQLATFYINEGLSLHEQIHNKGKPFPKGSVPRGYRPGAYSTHPIDDDAKPGKKKPDRYDL